MHDASSEKTTPAKKSVRDAARELRQLTGVGQVEFAQLIGYAYPSVQRFEGKDDLARQPQALAAYARLAREKGREDLYQLFADAVASALGEGIVSLLLEHQDRPRFLRVEPPQSQSQTTTDNPLHGTLPSKEQEISEASTSVPVIESESNLNGLELRPGDEQWVSELLFLLHHADQDTKNSIQQNLGTFARLTRLVQEAKRGQPDRVPAPIPEDRAGRMERLRELRDRSRERRGISGGDQTGVPRKKGKDTPPTGTGGRH